MIKEKFLTTYSFLKLKVIENKLRTGSLLCLLLVLLSFFMPFMSAKIDVSLSGFGDNIVEVINPEADIINLSLGDFVLQKPIDDLTIYGLPLGSIRIFDQSILQLLRTPISESGLITNVNEALANPALDFIIDPRLQEIIDTNFQEGESINLLLKGGYSILQGARSVADTINTTSIKMRESMAEVNATMATIDNYKSQANGFVFMIFFLIMVLMALIIYKRAHIGLSIFFSGLLSILFINIGGAVSFINTAINEQLAQLTSQINATILETVRSFLTGTLGNLGAFIADFIGGNSNFLFMSFFINLNIGYWLITLGLLGTFILLILVAYQNKKIKNNSSENLLLIEKDLAKKDDQETAISQATLKDKDLTAHKARIISGK